MLVQCVERRVSENQLEGSSSPGSSLVSYCSPEGSYTQLTLGVLAAVLTACVVTCEKKFVERKNKQQTNCFLFL